MDRTIESETSAEKNVEVSGVQFNRGVGSGLPFSDNKLIDWIKKYQVGRAAKWSKTIFKTLQKKQMAFLFGDEAIGVVKEGCKR